MSALSSTNVSALLRSQIKKHTHAQKSIAQSNNDTCSFALHRLCSPPFMQPLCRPSSSVCFTSHSQRSTPPKVQACFSPTSTRHNFTTFVPQNFHTCLCACINFRLHITVHFHACTLSLFTDFEPSGLNASLWLTLRASKLPCHLVSLLPHFCLRAFPHLSFLDSTSSRLRSFAFSRLCAFAPHFRCVSANLRLCASAPLQVCASEPLRGCAAAPERLQAFLNQRFR